MTDIFGTVVAFAYSAAVIAGLIFALYILHTRLLAMYANRPLEQYRRQLIMLSASITTLVFAILIIPIGSEMRGQLLSLLGILLSATIALSSTTIVGNAMAGVMLKTLRKIRPGFFVRVNEHYGRVTEMDLLHTEIQTEDRDLTTLPNLYLVMHPVTVLRNSGTILSVEVSLGYDVPRQLVERTLITAAKKTGLVKPFVQIRELGDFSVTYRIAGLAENLEELIAKRRLLRANTLDELHGSDVEIVSPNFMTTRAFQPTTRFVPKASVQPVAEEPVSTPDAFIFDKAEKAESIEKLRESREEVENQISQRNAILKEHKDEVESPQYVAASKDIENLENKLERLNKVIAAAEARITKD